MKNSIKVFLIIVISLLTVSLSIFVISRIRTAGINKKIDEVNVTMTPSVDFVQPYMFAHEKGESFDYDKYFGDLESIGYDTIIVQMTRTEEEDGSSTFYYPTTITSDLVEKVNRNDEYILEELLTECDKRNFDVFIGLSVEEYSWWALTCYYDDTYMNHCADTDVYMINEIYNQFNSHKSFIGWYFAFELFSNPIGWEKLWAKNMNKFIEAVDKLEDNRPILLSPFRQIILGNVTDEYLMWKNFFKHCNFRSIDIMCPQDSIGKLKDNEISFKKIYDYLDATKKATTEAGLHFWVNCELFITPDESIHLYDASIDRIVKQIKNANRVAEKIVTFSASHYMLGQGTVDTLENRLKLYDDYKDFYNNLNR